MISSAEALQNSEGNRRNVPDVVRVALLWKFVELEFRMPLIKYSITLSPDKASATIWREDDNGSRTEVIVANTASLDALLADIGRERADMLPAVSERLPEGFLPFTAIDPPWWVTTDNGQKFAALFIRHPAFGWLGNGFSRHEAGNMAKWLRKVTTFAATRDTHSPAETSFGGEEFLVTTGGLGFYYYGKGENRIGPNPFEQIEYDSDRSAGIVAAAIVERRLEQALLSAMKSDQTSIAKDLFRASGALGTFSTKIELAYMLNLISSETFGDLKILNKIRNDFAHQLHLDSFDVDSIRDRCLNLGLVDRHVGPVLTSADLDSSQTRPNPFLGLPDCEQKLKDPRFRFVMTAQLIGNALGAGADNPESSIPFI